MFRPLLVSLVLVLQTGAAAAGWSLHLGGSMPQGLLSARRDAGSLLLSGGLRQLSYDVDGLYHLSPFVSAGTRWDVLGLEGWVSVSGIWFKDPCAGCRLVHPQGGTSPDLDESFVMGGLGLSVARTWRISRLLLTVDGGLETPFDHRLLGTWNPRFGATVGWEIWRP